MSQDGTDLPPHNLGAHTTPLSLPKKAEGNRGGEESSGEKGVKVRNARANGRTGDRQGLQNGGWEVEEKNVESRRTNHGRQGLGRVKKENQDKEQKERNEGEELKDMMRRVKLVRNEQRREGKEGRL